MNILLDTNALIQLLNSDATVFGQKAQKSIAEADNVYVSPISIVEIRIKAMLGKLEVPDDLVDRIARANIKQKPLEVVEADAIGLFPGLAKHDPFDRMLLAQAQCANLSLLSSDKFLISLKLPFVIDSQR